MALPVFPDPARNASTIDLKKPREWYAGPEAARIAAIIASFQTPAGGWCKNTDFTRGPRRPGEFYGYGYGKAPTLSSREELTSVRDPGWGFAGTFDNDATTTELRFLFKVLSARPDADPAVRKAFLGGIRYVLDAQYPNGGWPQVWPLQGGYHDAVTFNDGAMQHVVELARDFAEADAGFIPGDLRKQLGAAWRKGLDCILLCQMRRGGAPTVWCQQYDPLTLEPCPARKYEMPALCSAESASLTLFLMKIPRPDPATIRSVNAAARWFGSSGITGKKFVSAPGGRQLKDDPGAPMIWARFYSLETGRPVFGDRDRTIHDDVSEITGERLDGYAWFVTTPRKVLDRYPSWAAAHATSQTGPSGR
jgi:PelA/Pel-15E family pectate lyase